MPVSFRIFSPLAAMAMAGLCIAPALAADAASDVPLVANPDEPATMELEEMFALASDCTVALSVLQENGATIESDPESWINVLVNLGDRVGRDPSLEYMFRQTEISALLEVEPEETSQWMTDVADECATLLPISATAGRKLNSASS